MRASRLLHCCRGQAAPPTCSCCSVRNAAAAVAAAAACNGWRRPQWHTQRPHRHGGQQDGGILLQHAVPGWTAAGALRGVWVVAAASAAEAAPSAATSAARGEWSSYPTMAVGRVMAAEANYVRVDVQRLGGLDAAAAAPPSPGPRAGAAAGEPEPGLWWRPDQRAEQQPGEQEPPRRELLCTVRALLKKLRQRVLVGDVVAVVAVDWAAGRGVVEAVAPRASELSDPAVANVDHVVLLFGLTQPPFEEVQVSRFLVSTEAAGLPVTLALNKADLVPESEVAARLEQCASWGYRAVAVSCASGRGLGELRAALAGRTSVVAGPSGAGKSSLINALRLGRHRGDEGAAGSGGGFGSAEGAYGGGASWRDDLREVRWAAVGGGTSGGGGAADGSGGRAEPEADAGADGGRCEEEQQWERERERAASGAAGGPSGGGAGGPGFLAVGDMSRIGRGKHTTRVVRLIPLPGGGLVADTPGFGLPTLDGVASSDLGELFPEFRAVRRAAAEAKGGGAGGGGCQFDDCAHVAEPGCAVRGAGLERYPHYLRFLDEVKAREDYDVRVMQLAKRQREGAVKAKTGRGGETRFEARLESKRHRVTSRRRAKQGLMRAAAAAEGDVEAGDEGPS